MTTAAITQRAEGAARGTTGLEVPSPGGGAARAESSTTAPGVPRAAVMGSGGGGGSLAGNSAGLPLAAERGEERRTRRVEGRGLLFRGARGLGCSPRDGGAGSCSVAAGPNGPGCGTAERSPGGGRAVRAVNRSAPSHGPLLLYRMLRSTQAVSLPQGLQESFST